ncbi:uncharacterized protein [Rutidosis leptorrhynchoides]|uniref:uncharacterized protein n=1 Tax=Rutidosis leptorrhynchoides TaxID=125765 RepID=UPI003A993758
MKCCWSREPFGRTSGELNNLRQLLSTVSVNSREKDSWRWSLSSNGQLTLKKLAAILDEQMLRPFTSQQCTLRNSLVPKKKIEIFTWRALKKRLPVRIELDKRELESVDHALFQCKLARDIWDRVFNWWGLGNVSNISFSELLNDNVNHSSSLHGKKLWQALKWSCAYLIWSNRNNLVFKGKTWNAPVALNEIQIRSFDWISNRARGRKLDWCTWISNPNIYLNTP